MPGSKQVALEAEAFTQGPYVDWLIDRLIKSVRR